MKIIFGSKEAYLFEYTHKRKHTINRVVIFANRESDAVFKFINRYKLIANLDSYKVVKVNYE